MRRNHILRVRRFAYDAVNAVICGNDSAQNVRVASAAAE